MSQKAILQYRRKPKMYGHFYLWVKPPRIKFFSTLDNDGGSDLTDRSTSPVADPLQVGKDLSWDLKVNARRKVLRVESEATDIFAFINHGSAQKTEDGPCGEG